MGHLWTKLYASNFIFLQTKCNDNTVTYLCYAENYTPQNVYVLILWTNEYIILYSKMDFANVIKLRISIWADLSELFGWAQSSLKSLYKEEDRRVRVRKDVMMKTVWSEVLWKQRMGPWAKGCRELRRWKKQGNEFCPVKFLWTCDLQNCKILNLSCFMQLSGNLLQHNRKLIHYHNLRMDMYFHI